MFSGWTRYCCWCIAVYFKFLAWKALHRTLCHAEHLGFRNFSAMNVDDIDLVFALLFCVVRPLSSNRGRLKRSATIWASGRTRDPYFEIVVVATNALFMAFPQHACVEVCSFMSRFIMPAGCILDITEVMSLVLDYWFGEFGSPNSKGISKGCAWGSSGGT